jgi:hypothetical protein
MNNESYQQWSKDLFDRWRNKIRESIQIGMDGAPFPERYFASNPRILFILKEIHGSPWKESDLCEHFRENEAQGKTWNNVVRWTQAIRQLVAEKRSPEEISFEQDQWIDQSKRHEILSRIAAINLKKVPGHSSSHMGEVHSHARQFSQLLEEQIATHDPHVIVACGVDLKQIRAFSGLNYDPSNGAWFHFAGEHRIIIWADHPQARKNAKGMFDGVVKACASVCSMSGYQAPKPPEL